MIYTSVSKFTCRALLCLIPSHTYFNIFAGADIARTVQDVDINNSDGYNVVFSVSSTKHAPL